MDFYVVQMSRDRRDAPHTEEQIFKAKATAKRNEIIDEDEDEVKDDDSVRSYIQA